MSYDNVLLGLPTYDGTLQVGTAQAAYMCSSATRRVFVTSSAKSLLSANCNGLYAMALNERDSMDLGWFAMLHADVVPAEWWLDTLIDIAERTMADMVSAVVAIKDERGISSTGIASGEKWRQFGRLTMAQLHHASFPPTFDIDLAADALGALPGDLRVADCPRFGLLANTGCMVLRLRPGFSERLSFQNHDTIGTYEGRYQAFDFSEDWHLAWEIAKRLGKVVCTTEVKTEHGAYRFPNHKAWGMTRNDCVEAVEVGKYAMAQ